MTKNLRYLAGAAVGAVVALGFTSCTYDPYYPSPLVGASYSSDDGYGDGYGYGGSGFSTSVFIGTGDPSWGYDPHSYSYYDYRSRRYYDPYSCGYYPIGYRPPVVYGVPHPYGWQPGGGYIRPPSRVYDVTLSNYRDREGHYRNSSYGWAKQVNQQPATIRRQEDNRRGQSNFRSGTDSRTSGGSSRETDSKYQGGRSTREGARTDVRTQKSGLSSRYNAPVTASQQPQGNPQKATRSEDKKQQQPDDDKKRDPNIAN